METRLAKRRKLIDSSTRNEAQATAVKADHISNLPDDVLYRILGLLPVKVIAATSILSRRWAQIWHSFPDLDFTTVVPPEDHFRRLDNLLRTKFKWFCVDDKWVRTFLYLYDRDGQQGDFISKVLSSRQKNAHLRALRLRAYVSLTCLNNLIRRALRFNVCELDVDFATDGSFNMPKRVISNGSLRILRLRSRFPGFRLPSLGALKSGSRFLQELALSRVILDRQPFLTDIFTDTSFPALKKLSLTDCFRLKRINIRCSEIQEVTLQHCCQLEVLEIDGARLEKLRVANCFHLKAEENSVKVEAPRLRVVEWEQNGLTKIPLFRNLTEMEVASVDFMAAKNAPVSTVISTSTSFLLRGLRHVRSLTLKSRCIMILSDRNFGSLTPFKNLGFLEVVVSFCESTRRALSLLFRNCPSLHTFILSVINRTYHERKHELWESTSLDKENYWETQMYAMKPFLKTLKLVKINGFMEYEDEMSILKFLLKYGAALEEMTLKCSSNNMHGTCKQIKSQLTGFVRASSNAKVYVQKL